MIDAPVVLVWLPAGVTGVRSDAARRSVSIASASDFGNDPVRPDAAADSGIGSGNHAGQGERAVMQRRLLDEVARLLTRLQQRLDLAA